jgi:predicted phosphodiesterase
MPIRAWIVSDLHYELMSRAVRNDLPQPVNIDLLIVAGDYHRAQRAITHAREQFPELPFIIVPGNHEHYKTGLSVSKNIQLMRIDAETDREVNSRITYVLENETVELTFRKEKIRIIGATLWTDFALLNDFAGHSSYAASAMNDFVYIRGEVEFELSPLDTVAWHNASRAFIRGALEKPFEGKTVVVTHHLPSIRSVSPRFKEDPLTPAFASACDDLLDLGADLWVHGHTHDSADYMAGRTRVVCNPRGYSPWIGGANIENKSFNPGLVITL